MISPHMTYYSTLSNEKRITNLYSKIWSELIFFNKTSLSGRGHKTFLLDKLLLLFTVNNVREAGIFSSATNRQTDR